MWNPARGLDGPDARAQGQCCDPISQTQSQPLEKLLEREIGLALYTDAMRLSSPIGRFRELWRVLESAFGQKGKALLKSLSQYEPILEHGFDAKELRQLYVLRGRASHAESNAGLEEYESVTSSVTEGLTQLERLVVEVILTKLSWGTKGLATDRVAALRTYVDRDGALVIVRPSD